MNAIIHETLSDLVFNKLRDMILAGELGPGDRLNGIEIADRLGVSRTPAREALSRLVIAGLAYKKSRIAFYVKEISISEIIEVYLARAALEGIAVRLAVDNITEKELKRLSVIIAEMEKIKNSTDSIDQVNRLNNEFHDIIIAASRTTILAKDIKNFIHRSEQFRVLAYQLPGRLPTSCREHRRIIAMIAAKKKDEAEQAMRRHRINTILHIAKSFGKTIAL